MNDEIYDVVIIGAGPAAIQAGIHATRRKTKVIMIGRPENSALYTAHVENYACIAGVQTGKALLEAGLKQLQNFGTEILAEDILKISQDDTLFAVETESGNHITTRTIIFCVGVSKKKLKVPGEKEFAGRGVSYCVDCDANFYRNATVAVSGNRSAAVDGALTLLGYADKVYLVAQELNVAPDLLKRLQNSAVELIDDSTIQSIDGENAVTGLTFNNDKKIKVDGIFIELGSKGALELATQVGVQLDHESFKYIDTNRKCETNIPGMYAAGDITGPPWQMAKAVGEGCVAGMEAASYAKKQKRSGSDDK